MTKPVILTAPRLSNDLHIGNYLGALLPMNDFASKHAGSYQFNLFVADLHGITTPIDYTKVQQRIFEYLRVFVASGFPIDEPNVHIYRQSYVPAHSELTWILDCFTGFGEMSRMTQFKDKSAKLGSDRVSVGLFSYPVLMAADILLYSASYVPVGEDQTQHLEFTRDIATRLNNQFGELFTVPKPVKDQHAFFGKEQGLRIKDLQDPTRKMSKSDDSGKGVIFLSDTPEAAAKKIMSATTDSFGEISYDRDKQPGIANLLELLALFTNREVQELATEFQGQTQYGPLKTAVAGAISAFLTDFQTRLAAVDDAAILAKLEQSERLMNEQANATLLQVQRAVGLRA